MEELDKYLSGQMSDEERRAFDRRLAEQPDLQAELLVREGLQQWRLQQRVAEATQLRKHSERRARRQRIAWGAAAIAGVLGALAWWYFQVQASSNPAQPPAPGLETPAGTRPSAPAEERYTPTHSSSPAIAEGPARQDTPGDLFPPEPVVRGQNEVPADRRALLDELWQTVYPPVGWTLSESLAVADSLLRQRSFAQAYVRLQRLEMQVPANDTLRLMKGYCLLEMREGAEALSYWNSLESRQPDWAAFLQWHRSLALLLTGEQAAAVKEFRAIAAQSGHPFAPQAQKALEAMRKGK